MYVGSTLIFGQFFGVPEVQKENGGLSSCVHQNKSGCHGLKVSSEYYGVQLDGYLLDCLGFLFAENDVVECDLVVHAYNEVEVVTKAEREAKNRLGLCKLKAHLLSLFLLQKK